MLRGRAIEKGCIEPLAQSQRSICRPVKHHAKFRSFGDIDVEDVEQLSNDADSVNLSLQDELNLLLKKRWTTNCSRRALIEECIYCISYLYVRHFKGSLIKCYFSLTA
ncbi:hypothetical protein ACJMK2_018761 [Sinanodonta woodiana]|uniref:Uncharacterized protein n=1 Tax=Sinanodonta woodiana TaxID=1069815 RepID=A0ABD3UHS8_SINWO